MYRHPKNATYLRSIDVKIVFKVFLNHGKFFLLFRSFCFYVSSLENGIHIRPIIKQQIKTTFSFVMH